MPRRLTVIGFLLAAVHLERQSIKDFHNRQFARIFKRPSGDLLRLIQKLFCLAHVDSLFDVASLNMQAFKRIPSFLNLSESP